ncbi:hypothetical protein ABC668_03600 [Pseudomonas aeruginosa]
MSVRVYVVIGLVIGAVLGFFMTFGFLSFSENIDALVGKSAYSLFKEVFAPMAAGFGGAVAGAYSSYYLALNESRKRQMEMDAELVNTSVYLLLVKLNEIVGIRKQGFLPYDKDPIRFLKIPVFSSGGFVQPPVDVRIITVLGKVGLGDISEKLYLADNGYASCLHCLELRNKKFLEVRELAERAGVLNGRSVRLDEYVETVGVPRLLGLYRVTEDLIEFLNKVVDDLETVLRAIEKGRENFVIDGRVSVMSLKFSDINGSKLSGPHFSDSNKLAEHLENQRDNKPT